MITNHSSVPDRILARMIEAAIDAYHVVYEPPVHDAHIIACRDENEMNRLAALYTRDEEQTREYNGIFLCPHDKEEPLRILLLVKEEAVVGAKRYFEEVETGSRRDDDIPQTERERRGIELAAYCHFAEMLQHEYSHLCSFERLMQATDWKDPEISGHSQDYHLYDEVIARYRGTYAMLCMMQSYMEVDLLYTMWISFWDDLLKNYKDRTDVLSDFINQQRDAIEAGNLEYMRRARMSGQDVVVEMERELGHPLKYRDQLTEKGAPKLTAEEVAEFLMCDDFDDPKMNETIFRTMLPLQYFTRNPYAIYEGAQIEGLIHSFYDFLLTKVGKEPEKRDLDLVSLMDTPYYLTADLKRTNEEVIKLPDLFMELRKIST